MALGLCLTELFKQGDSAIYSSLRILPFVMVLIFAIIFNGHMMQRFGYYMPWYFFGSAFELVAAVLMCMSSKSAPLVANTTFSTSQLDLER